MSPKHCRRKYYVLLPACFVRSSPALFGFGLVNSFVCRLPQVLSLLWRTETRCMSEPLKVLLDTITKFAMHTGSQALLLQQQ